MSQFDSLQLNTPSHIIVLGKRSDFARLPRHLVILDRHELANILGPVTTPKASDLPRLKQFYRRVSQSQKMPEADDFAGHFAAALLASGYCAVRIKKDFGGPTLPVELARDIKPIEATTFQTASSEDKYARVLEMVPQHLPGELKGAFAELVSPVAIGTTVAILVVWAGSHAIGVGFAIDVLLLAIGFAMVGWSIFGAVGDVIEFFEIMESARGDADLNRAAQKLAGAIAALGVGVFIAILTRGAGRIAAARKANVSGKSGGGSGAAASESQIAKYKPKTEESRPKKKRTADDDAPPATASGGKVKPTGKAGGSPTGRRTKISPDDDAATTRSLQRENDSADVLADAGYKVEQNPAVPGNKDPDYLIEGEVFDCKAPSTSRARNAASEVEKSVSQGQADRIVLNLEDSDISVADMKKQLDDWPIDGLKEVIAIKDGQVLPFWP